jgi:predicted histidine transporter YuiF (NhaC family)
MNHSQVINLTEVRQFLIENLIESKAMIVRLFDVNVNTLITYMRRHQSNKQHQHEKHNKILKKHEENVVHRLIESLLAHDVSLIINVVFSDIVTLKVAQKFSPSSES